jgi:carbon starvation protein
MIALITITMTAGYQKVFDANPRIGFLSGANEFAAQIASGIIPSAKIAETQRLIFNLRLDAAVTLVLAVMILLMIIEAMIQWWVILGRHREAVLHESPYVRTQWAESYSGAAHGDD